MRLAASVEISDRGRPQLDAFSFAFSISAAISGPFSTMWANGSPGSHLAVEGQEHRPHRVLQPAVGDHHVEDRLRVVGDLLPDADRLEQPPRRRHDRGRARIGAGAPERRIGDHDRKGGAEPLAQRDRQREPGKAAAADQHVGALCAIRS